jgi:type II secretory pathway component PulF
MPPAVTPFLYMASRPDGRSALGVRSARNEAQLAELLRRERLVLLRTWRLPAWAARPARLGQKDQAELHAQLAQLLGRGVPLVEALDVAARSVSEGARGTVLRIRDLVSSGSSLADACRSVGVFDAVTIAVYRAADRSGDLSGAARQLASSLRRQLAMRDKAVTVAIYPVIVVSISVLVCLVMLTIVVPLIGETLIRQQLTLPGYTRAMIAVGVFTRDHALWILTAVLGLVTLGYTMRSRLAPAALSALRALPLIRSLVLAQQTARFFTVMAALTRSGVPVADGLAIAAQVVTHRRLRPQLDTLRRRLVEGGALRQLIDAVDALPLGTRRLLIAAERSGDLDSAFEALAQDSAEEVDRRSMRLLAVLEPFLIVAMFLVIGGLLFAVMWPLIRLAAAQQF